LFIQSLLRDVSKTNYVSPVFKYSFFFLYLTSFFTHACFRLHPYLNLLFSLRTC
jgi:hypothetical protein